MKLEGNTSVIIAPNVITEAVIMAHFFLLKIIPSTQCGKESHGSNHWCAATPTTALTTNHSTLYSVKFQLTSAFYSDRKRAT